MQLIDRPNVRTGHGHFVLRWSACVLALAAGLAFAASCGGTAVAAEDGANMLYETTFADGAKGWQAVHQAEVSDLARRPGGKSLLIKQWEEGQDDSAWLSPVFEHPGTPVRISVWAADNYIDTKDFSFSAAFELVPCDRAGELTGSGGDWTYIPWESERYIPQFRHTFTKEGLVWEHYEAVKQAKGDHFRLRFCWPKSRMKGECYFTDLRLTAVEGKQVAPDAAAGEKKQETGYGLEISTPANANLFYRDTPRRFEFLVFRKDEPLGDMADAALAYEITDYEHFRVASGTLPLEGAKPYEVPKGLQRRRKHWKHNLHLSAVLEDEAAKAVGREFFITARVIKGGQTLAEDTVTYGVVDPRQTKPEEIENCRFISFDHGGGVRNTESERKDQALIHKLGCSLTHTWDYSGWKKAQPEKDGPITIPKGPEHPKLVYCPNLEQVRGRKPNHPWGDVARMAPAWAVLDDPLRPGCKTFDIDAYVEYIVEYVRTNRHRIVQVVPSGLERRIDARTLELHRKAYAALKKEFPDLPVGMMVWGVLSENGRQLILKEKLYEVADFFDTHVYLSAVDWSEWEKLQKRLKKMGEPRRLISTEFARVGGTNQLQRARDVLTSNLDAHAHDMVRITNFLRYVNGRRDPILREDMPGNNVFAFMQVVDRPRIASTIEAMGGERNQRFHKSWRRGRGANDYRGSSLMPMLPAMSYYNLVQNVECADFKNVFQPTDRSIAYVYERDGKTILYLFLNEPSAPATLALQDDTPYRMQDLYGRVDRVTPDGASLVMATLDPLALLFEDAVPALYDAKTAKDALAPVEGGVNLPVLARGASGTAEVRVPAVFEAAKAVRAEATVDGTWPKAAPLRVPLAADAPEAMDLPVTVSADRTPGSYTFTTRVYAGDKLVSVLKQPLTVSEVLTLELRGAPMTKTEDPAVVVVVRSLADQPMQGMVRLDNRFFGTGFTPAAMEGRYEVAPRGTAKVRFAIPRDQANLASSYVLAATLTDDGGFSVRTEDDVSFHACEKTKTPITVDGDLKDWDLDNLLSIPFERWCRGPREPDEFSGHFYTRWDDDKLYFAAVITDSVPVVNGTDQVVWHDDNIMFGIYPWRWHMGEPLNTGYYREHLGPIQNGPGSFMRVGHVPSGPSTAEGAEIAVTRTKTGYVYEWAYPAKSLYPLDLKTSGGFRLSMSVWDQHQKDKKGWGKFSWLTFAGFNTSVNAQPDLWRQFTFVE